MFLFFNLARLFILLRQLVKVFDSFHDNVLRSVALLTIISYLGWSIKVDGDRFSETAQYGLLMLLLTWTIG